MKKVILFLIITVSTMLSTVWAYDFSTVVSSGQTLYFNISSTTTDEAEITYPGSADYYYGYTYTSVYGVMGMNTFFGAMLVWWIIGAVMTVINYFVYKLILAPSILKMFYLKKISLNSEELVNANKCTEKE